MEYKPLAKRHTCKDGTTLSIQASESHYCTPRDNFGPYTEVEVGYIKDKNGKDMVPPKSWSKYADGDFPSSVYGYVPIKVVQKFCDRHGGLLIHI